MKDQTGRRAAQAGNMWQIGRWARGIAAFGSAVVMVACGAPRDPDLEMRALKAQKKAAEPAPVVEISAPPAVSAAPKTPAAPERPTRRYGSAEIAEILAKVPGAGGALTATFETGVGTFSCELFEQETPETVANFVGLAVGALPWAPKVGAAVRQTPFYDGTLFHRAIDQFIVQGGRPAEANGTGPGWRIERETAKNDRFDTAGALAMLDDGGATHGSQFLMTLRPDRSLAKKYTVFGSCAVLDVPRAIAAAEKKPAAAGESAAIPVDPVVLKSVRISRGSPATP